MARLLHGVRPMLDRPTLETTKLASSLALGLGLLAALAGCSGGNENVSSGGAGGGETTSGSGTTGGGGEVRRCTGHQGPTGKRHWLRDASCSGALVPRDAGDGETVLLWITEGSGTLSDGRLETTAGEKSALIRMRYDGSVTWLSEPSEAPFQAYAADPNGGVVVTGSTSPDPAAVGDAVVQAKGDADNGFFVARIDARGHFTNVKSFGPTDEASSGSAFGVAVDDQGKFVVLAFVNTEQPFMLGGDPIPPRGGGSDDSVSAFAAFGPSGEPRWSKGIGAATFIEFAGSPDGAVSAAGRADDELDLGNGVSVPRYDAVLATFDATGTALWASAVEGAEFHYIRRDRTGYLYVVGERLEGSGDLHFGDGVTLPAGRGPFFVAKYGADGRAIFATSFPAKHLDERQWTVTPAGRVILGETTPEGLDLRVVGQSGHLGAPKTVLQGSLGSTFEMAGLATGDVMIAGNFGGRVTTADAALEPGADGGGTFIAVVDPE